MSCGRFKNICSGGGSGARTPEVRGGDLSGASINPARGEAGCAWLARPEQERGNRQATNFDGSFLETLHFDLTSSSIPASSRPCRHPVLHSGRFPGCPNGWTRLEKGFSQIQPGPPGMNCTRPGTWSNRSPWVTSNQDWKSCRHNLLNVHGN